MDAETRRPIGDAQVSFTLSDGLESVFREPLPPPVATSDTGTFVLTDVPATAAGYLRARKEGYVEGGLGAKWPRDNRGFIDIQRSPLTQLVIPMWRGGGIRGIVTDERRRPLAKVQVHAWAKGDHEGEVWHGTTDADGEYRIAGLLAGDYIVGVNVTHVTRKPGHNDDAKPCPDAAALCSELTQPLARPRLAIEGGPATYETVLFPSARESSQAVPIAVRVGEDRYGVDLQLRPSPGVQVTGRLVSRANASYPIDYYVWLHTGEAQPESLPAAIGILHYAADTFTFLDVPPGRYLLTAATKARGSGSPSVFETTAWIDVPIGGLKDLEIDLAQSTVVTGKFIYRGKLKQPFNDVVTIWTFKSRWPTGNSGVSSSDGQFEIEGVVPAKYVVNSLSTGDGWEVESITAGGRDLVRQPLEVTPGGIRDLVVTLTDSPGRVTFTLVDADGTPTSEAVAVFFPAQMSTWGQLEARLAGVVTRGSRTAGQITQPLPSGDYLVAAIPVRELEHWPSEPLLRGLAKRAVPVRVTSGSQQTVVLALPRGSK